MPDKTEIERGKPPLLDLSSPLLELPKVEKVNAWLVYAVVGLAVLLVCGTAAAVVKYTRGRADPEPPRRRTSLHFSDPQLARQALPAADSETSPDDPYAQVDEDDPRWRQPITQVSPDSKRDAAELARSKQGTELELPQPHEGAGDPTGPPQEPHSAAGLGSGASPAREPKAPVLSLAPAKDSLKPPQMPPDAPPPGPSAASLGGGGLGLNVGPQFLPQGLRQAESPDEQQLAWAGDKRAVRRSGGQRPRARCQVSAGEEISAHLERVIDTTVGAQLFTLRFMVDRAVECTGRGDLLAIPQGAIIVGSVNTRVAAGQKRVHACAERVEVYETSDQFPDGWTADLHCAPIASADGAVGVDGELDQHLPEQFVAALITMMTNFGARLVGGTQTTYGPSVGQLAAEGMALGANNIGSGYVQQLRAIKPTLRFVPTGQPVRIIMSSDVVLEGLQP